jgi:MFS family permease
MTGAPAGAGDGTRRGWAIVAALSITETTSWGVLYYGFPVFLKPMEAAFGWSRAALTGAFSLALAVQGVTAIAVGRWLDRHSPRLLMTAGSVAATALVLAWSRVGSLPAFYLLWAAIGVVMATVLYEPAFTVVTKWFVAQRRRALTAVTLVAGFASFIFLPLENRLIEAHGWRNALVWLAVVLGVITVPLHALVLRPAPGMHAPPVARARDAGAGASAATGEWSTREALRARAFWFLAAAMVASSFVASALAVHQVAYLTERGYSPAFAAGLTGTLGAMQVPGRLLFAPLLRWLPRPVVTTIVFASLSAGLLVLALGTGTTSVWVFAVVYGMGRGMTTLLRATLVGDLFGARHYGSIAGVLAFCATAATALGPVFAGVLYDAVGGYRAVIWVLIGMAAVSAVAASQVERASLDAHRG